MGKKECKHEEWNPCGNDFYSCRKCGILRTSQQVNLYAEKDKQIADLEAKLAEVKNSCDYYMNRANDLLLKDQDKISFAVEQLEKVKWWCQGNAIQCFYNEAETEIKEKHIVVDRPQENGSPSLIKYIDNQIKTLRGEK